MLDEQLIRCHCCKHFVQGFDDNEQALEMRRNWCGYCTASAPVGKTMPLAQLKHDGLHYYAFPVVKDNWRCAAFAYKHSERQ